MGGVITLLSVYVTASIDSALLVWMVLAGLTFIAVGMETKNPVVHFIGACWIVASVTSFVFYPDIMLALLFLVFAVGMASNFAYLYRLLGRRPKFREIFSFATQALSLRGLAQPIDRYHVLAILVSGNIGAENVIGDVLARLESRCTPILLLGPTAPMNLVVPDAARVGWVASVSGLDLEYPLLPPEDPSRVNIYLMKTLDALPETAKPVVLGDFLDNMIPLMDVNLFHKYFSDLASAARIANHTIVCVVKVDIHRDVAVNVVKRFADVIIENREREERNRLFREVRVSNRVDNVYTDWEKY